jgi:hypothetical protein
MAAGNRRDAADPRRPTPSAATRDGVYDHDVGDSWEHQLLVEKTDVPVTLFGTTTCAAGRRACPPEDPGGTSGDAELLAAVADPADEEHEEYPG